MISMQEAMRRDDAATATALHAQARRSRCKVRCCHGRDTVPRAWTTLFRFLKAAYQRGLEPVFNRDLAGCPCTNSDGYDSVLMAAYRHGMVPEYEHVRESRALALAYRHGLEPRRCDFSHVDDVNLVPVLAAAYAAGYRPNPGSDFHGRDLDLERAWSDAVSYGAQIDFETLLDIGSGPLMRAAYARRALTAELTDVPAILEHGALAEAYGAGLPFDFDTQVALLDCDADAVTALAAAYEAGAAPHPRHFEHFSGDHRARAQIAAYLAGLLVEEVHGLPDEPMDRRVVLEIARAQRRRAAAVVACLGPGLGQRVITALTPGGRRR
jgi:hypothetical protein